MDNYDSNGYWNLPPSDRQQSFPPPPYLPPYLPQYLPIPPIPQQQQYDDHRRHSLPAQIGPPPPLSENNTTRRQSLPSRLQPPPPLLSRQPDNEILAQLLDSYSASIKWRVQAGPSPFYVFLDNNNKTKQKGWVRNLMRIPTTKNNPTPLRYYDLLIKTTPSAAMSGFSNTQVMDVFYHAFDMNKASMCSAKLKKRRMIGNQNTTTTH